MGRQRTIQIVCADQGLTQQYRTELEQSGEPYPLRLAQTPDEARRSLRYPEPSVILLDESAVLAGAPAPSLESAVASLTEVAPVVVVAAPEGQSELAFLITSGAVDFVGRSGNFVSIAAGLIERRIRSSEYASGFLAFPEEESDSDFGEILRHEVNNPLTGILGNAELLLARRDRLPPIAVERLETIAELAVRLRETVRRLSHAWGMRSDDVHRSI